MQQAGTISSISPIFRMPHFPPLTVIRVMKLFAYANLKERDIIPMVEAFTDAFLSMEVKKMR